MITINKKHIGFTAILNFFKKIIHSARTEAEPVKTQVKVYARSEHNISRAQISENALKVLYKLQKEGYSAYLVGGDGVLERIKDYETQGFKAYYKNRRYRGLGSGRTCSQGLCDIREIDFEQLASYDDEIFPAERHRFLECWISRPKTKGYAVLEAGKLSGYGVVRPCCKGYKIGPLFADDHLIAEKIFSALRGEVPQDQDFFLIHRKVIPTQSLWPKDIG